MLQSHQLQSNLIRLVRRSFTSAGDPL